MDINSKESISVNARTVTSEPKRLIYFLNLEQNIIASVPIHCYSKHFEHFFGRTNTPNTSKEVITVINLRRKIYDVILSLVNVNWMCHQPYVA